MYIIHLYAVFHFSFYASCNLFLVFSQYSVQNPSFFALTRRTNSLRIRTLSAFLPNRGLCHFSQAAQQQAVQIAEPGCNRQVSPGQPSLPSIIYRKTPPESDCAGSRIPEAAKSLPFLLVFPVHICLGLPQCFIVPTAPEQFLMSAEVQESVSPQPARGKRDTTVPYLLIFSFFSP